MIRVYPHQRAVYQALSDTASLFFEGSWQLLWLKPRFTRFIAGATGTGKSFLVRALAKDLNLPLLELAASCWIPLGCSDRGGRQTWHHIVEFVHHHERGIIFLDEIDKLTGNVSWMQYIRVEAFYLIDGRMPDVLKRSNNGDEDGRYAGEVEIERLSNSMLVIGAGAFQDIIDHRQNMIAGFCDLDLSQPDGLDPNEMARMIPREIINRFATPILNLPSMGFKDYRAMLDVVCQNAPSDLAPHLIKIGEQTLDAALRFQAGCRWIEEVLLEALMQHRRLCSRNSREEQRENKAGYV